MAKISFGLHSSGRLIDATASANGIKCDCVCPSCRAPLIARQGQIKVPHFAHYDSRDCPTGAMTALHLAAQHLIVQRGVISLPKLSVSVLKRNPSFGDFERTDSFFSETTRKLADAKTEVRIQNGRVVDVGGTDQKMGFVAVEVRVHHEVDPNKSKDIKTAAVPCIEVDLRDICGQLLTMQSLATHLFDRVDNKKWIFHPLEDQCRQQLLDDYLPWVERKEAELAAREREEAERLRQQQKDLFRKQKLIRDNARMLVQRHEEIKDQVSKALGVPYERWPKPINLPDLNGKQPFLVPAALWHGVMFDLCIFSRLGTSLAATPLPSAEWISREVGRRLGCLEYIPSFDMREASFAVRAYLSYLTKFGLLELRSSELYLNLRYSHSQIFKHAPTLSKRQEPTRKTVAWPEIWPTPKQMYVLAKNFADEHAFYEFNSQLFVNTLCGYSREPKWNDMQRLMIKCNGSGMDLKRLLNALSVLVSESTITCSGQPKPWDTAYRKEN